LKYDSSEQLLASYTVPPTAGTFGAANITVGADGTVWLTPAVRSGTTGYLGKISPQGVLSVFSFPNVGLFRGLAVGPDGNVWTGEFDRGMIACIRPDGNLLHEYPVPTPGSQPYSLAIGPDGSIWFTDDQLNQIGRVTLQGQFSLYPIPTANSGVADIAAGPGNTLWFTEGAANKVGKFDLGLPPVPVVVARDPGTGAVNPTATIPEGGTLLLDASGTTDPEGDAVTYQWDFDGDGSFDATGTQATHTFTENGVYYVTVRVIDGTGQVATQTFDVTVNEVQPTISFNSSVPPDANGNRTALEDSRGLPITVVGIVADPSLADFQSGRTYSWTVTKDGLPYASSPGTETSSGTQNGGGSATNHYGITPDSAGTYVFTLAFTDRDGSATASLTINVIFLPIPSHVQLTNVNFVRGPDHLTPVGSTLYFEADDGVHGNQLWRTDDRPGDAVPVQGWTNLGRL
jgi:PKD repeat protein